MGSANLNLNHGPANLKLQKESKEITVCDLFSQEIVLLYEEKEIAYKSFNENELSPKLDDEKMLNKRVDLAIERQSKTKYKPASDHPWMATIRTIDKA